MADVGSKLRIKYKLRSVPSDKQASRWADRVEELVRNGENPETAGARAARQMFDIDEGLILKAEADTIESLLMRAKSK